MTPPANRNWMNSIIICVGWVLLPTCSAEPGLTPVPVAASVPQDTIIHVHAHGAYPDDGVDDTHNIIRAISALPKKGGTIQFSQGVYLLQAQGSGLKGAIYLVHQAHIEFAGEGFQETTLRMAPAKYSGDTHMFLLERSSHIAFRDLALDGNRAEVDYSDEQSHGVEARESTDLQFERVLFQNMHGDGIRLLGAIESGLHLVEEVTVVDCKFMDNGRSGIAVQRGVRGVTVTGSIFTRISDQSIDMEPTGAYPGSTLAPREFLIANNHFFETSDLSITITGLTSKDQATGIVVTGNRLEGTAIFVFNGQDVTIEDNSIAASGRWSPIGIRKASEGIQIRGNEIDGRGNAAASIALNFHTSAAPRMIEISDNTIFSGSSPAVYARDSEMLRITGNVMHGSHSYAIIIEDIIPDSPLRDFLIEGNRFLGYGRGVRVHSRHDPLTGVCSTGNALEGLAEGIAVEGPVELSCP